MDRRRFLKYCLASGSLLLTGRAFGATYERSIYMYNIHTGEYVKEVYWENGFYNPEAIKNINYILRDYRTNEIKQIDIDLIELVYDINSILDNREPIHVISGYRSPLTNEMLRRVSSGVAKRSMHTFAKAIDLSIPKVPLHRLREVAIKLARGGVGYYPLSNFVHVDTGNFRVW